jgi:hypothetical protein
MMFRFLRRLAYIGFARRRLSIRNPACALPHEQDPNAVIQMLHNMWCFIV